MITRGFVEEAFQHLLGRTPSAAEIAMLVVHFGSPGVDQASELHNSILRSEEFRNRRVGIYRWAQFDPLELDAPRFVFVHLEKCAGTTLRTMLESQFPTARICPERLDGLGNWTINELASYDFFAGHFDLSVARSIPGRLRVITMLREPKSRLLSLFHFWKSHIPDVDRDSHNLMILARGMDAHAFFSEPFVRSHPSIRDAMAGQLIRTDGKHVVGADNILVENPSAALKKAWVRLGGLSAFGIAERFDASRLLLNRTLDLKMNAIKPAQVLADLAKTNSQLREVPRSEMTTQLSAVLDGLVTVDSALYRRACALFARRISLGRRILGSIGARTIRHIR